MPRPDIIVLDMYRFPRDSVDAGKCKTPFFLSCGFLGWVPPPRRGRDLPQASLDSVHARSEQGKTRCLVRARVRETCPWERRGTHDRASLTNRTLARGQAELVWCRRGPRNGCAYQSNWSDRFADRGARSWPAVEQWPPRVSLTVANATTCSETEGAQCRLASAARRHAGSLPDPPP
jgi:hypothetical protein